MHRFVGTLVFLFCAGFSRGETTLGYWRFEKDSFLSDSSGSARTLESVGSGLEPGGPAAPERIPLSQEINRSAALFDGKGAVKIPCSGKDELFLEDGQDFTFECWLRTGPAITTSVLFSKVREDPDVPGTRSHGFDFLSIAEKDADKAAPLHFRIYTRQDGLLYLIRIDDALAPSTTYHVALTREDATYRVYIDGILCGEADCEETIASQGDLFLGALGLGDRPFKGHLQPAGARLDEVRLTDKALQPKAFLIWPELGEPKPRPGWELPFPIKEAAIPEAVPLDTATSSEPQKSIGSPYVPSQALAPFPQRLNPRTRSRVCGIQELGPDRQRPVPGGVQLLQGNFEIHHRRAGALCRNVPVFSLRMETFRGLASIALGVKNDETFIRLDRFALKRCEVHPGRVSYFLEEKELSLGAWIEAVAPASVPAYGLLLRVTLYNRSDEPKKLNLVALASPGREPPAEPPQGQVRKRSHLRLDVPHPPLLCDPRRPQSPPLLLHDTEYVVWVGFEGNAQALGNKALSKPLDLPAGASVTAHLTAVIDSPGHEETGARERIEDYFQRNEHLPKETQERLTEEAMDTFVHIVVQGEEAFHAIQEDPKGTFASCLASWDKGLYRQRPVRFLFPDDKLQSFAHLVANDHFPGIVQPPGIVHDAKYGDTWNYIFCYRHVHAACDIGLENAAIDYLRLLSANQQEDGRIASIRANFATSGHGTRFDASYIDSLFHYYRWTGDHVAVRELWPTVVRAAEHIDTSLDPDKDFLYRDIIHQWKSDYDNRGPSSSFQTAIVWRAYRDLAELAEALSLPQSAEYRAKAENIRQAAMNHLWSDELSMLGPKGPLGVLRSHPQSLEVEMPIWTGFVDPYKSVMLAEWFLANLSFRDEAGGLWMYHNDWWPVVWSQHMGSPGDYLMVGWALFLTGRHEEGCRILQTVAWGSYRHPSPGFNYTFDEHGVHGGNDPATAQGAFFRCLVEGLFGVEPHVDDGWIAVQPRFPEGWDHARFERAGLRLDWKRKGAAQDLSVRTAPTVRAQLCLPIRSSVEQVSLNGRDVDFTLKPGMRHAWVCVHTQPGGGRLQVECGERSPTIQAPTETRPSERVEIRVNGLDSFETDDRFGFFRKLSHSASGVTAETKKAGCGLALLFLNCRLGNAEWIEPVVMRTLPRCARDVQQRTCLEAPPAGAQYVPVDLSSAYTDDIQSCLAHPWRWDAYDHERKKIAYWTMPLFVLTQPLPKRIRVGEVPFLLGAMGPGGEKEKDLLLIANTAPYALPTAVTVALEGKHLHKIYILSLNMNLPQKCYVPAGEATIRYSDGTNETTQLIPPLNFDSFFQDFAIDTLSLPLHAKPGYGQDSWVPFGGVDLYQHHLTMTAFRCDPKKKSESMELRSIATETFIGLAGLTLLEKG